MKIENIKFKAKRLDNGEWIDGSLTHFKNVAYIRHEERDYHGKFYLITYKVNPDTVCQFTGLKDRNGVEVFENDIVKAVDWEEKICNVEYKDYGFCLYGKCFRDGIMPLFVAIGNCDIYVIGNKFDKEK